MASWRRLGDWACIGIAFLFIATTLAVILFCDAACAVSPPAVMAVGNDPYAAFIAEAAQRFDIPATWIRQIIRVESGGDRRAVSPKGAMGLMQLMPMTWADLRARYGLGHDPFDPHDNILAGVAYLREMHDRYGSPGFLAAYHAGPGRYEDYRDRRRALPPETRAYVAELLPLFSEHDSQGPVVTATLDPHPWTRAPLFAVHMTNTATAGRIASGQASNSTSPADVARDMYAIAPRADGLFVVLATGEHRP